MLSSVVSVAHLTTRVDGLRREPKGASINELGSTHGVLLYLLALQSLGQPHIVVFELISFKLIELCLNKVGVCQLTIDG